MSTLIATADDLSRAIDGTLPETVATNTLWVVVAAILVLFMQAGFAGLEMGFRARRTPEPSSPRS